MVATFLNNIDGKNSVLKRRIITLCINEGDYSIADFSKELNTSIPTITKLVGELIDEGFLVDMGKAGTNGGRRPSVYGLNPSAGYFVGAEVRKQRINIAITNFKGELIDHFEDMDFKLTTSEESFKSLCGFLISIVEKTDINKDKILAYGITLTGRVNSETGYCFSYFIGEGRPLVPLLEHGLGCPVFLENDSRAMAYGEHICGAGKEKDNFLFINVDWGLGMGMI